MTILDRVRIDGRVAIVTGASSGLGVAFAVALAEGEPTCQSARVERTAWWPPALVEDAGGRRPARTDVASPDDCRQLVDATVRAFGRVDILVSNAGIGTSVPATREVPGNFDPSSISTSTGVTGWLRHVPG
jgi:NAD(P)-dependent dehydrogenase (short-subunit alcohol dehydrogenase family)